MCDYYNVEKTDPSGELRKLVVKIDYCGDITETDLNPRMKYFSQQMCYINGPILSVVENGHHLYKDGILISSGKPVKYAVYPFVVYESGDLYNVIDEPTLLDTDIVHLVQLPTSTLSIRRMTFYGRTTVYYQVGLIELGADRPLEWFRIDSLLCTGHNAFAGRIKAGGPITVWGICWDAKINSGLIKNGLLSASFDKEVVDVAAIGIGEDIRLLVKSIDDGTYFHYATENGWAYDDALTPSEFLGRHGTTMFVMDDGSRYLCELCVDPLELLVVGRLID